MEKIIQITAGRGPAECTWVVAQVLKKVLDEAQEQGKEKWGRKTERLKQQQSL